MNWLLQHWVEILGTIFGLIYIYFSIKQNIWLWFFGLISSALAFYQCLVSGIYADMAINAYYVGISIYGWILWKYSTQKTESGMHTIHFLSRKEIVLYTMTCLALWLFIAEMLKFTDSTVPYLDAFTTATAIVATYLLTQKYIENWLIFVLTDAFSIGLFYYKELYFFAFLFAVYTVLAVVGYFNWKKMATRHLT